MGAAAVYRPGRRGIRTYTLDNLNQELMRSFHPKLPTLRPNTRRVDLQKAASVLSKESWALKMHAGVAQGKGPALRMQS